MSPEGESNSQSFEAVVGDGESTERLLPFVATVVLDVDLAARQVRVEWEMDW